MPSGDFYHKHTEVLSSELNGPKHDLSRPLTSFTHRQGCFIYIYIYDFLDFCIVADLNLNVMCGVVVAFSRYIIRITVRFLPRVNAVLSAVAGRIVDDSRILQRCTEVVQHRMEESNIITNGYSAVMFPLTILGAK